MKKIWTEIKQKIKKIIKPLFFLGTIILSVFSTLFLRNKIENKNENQKNKEDIEDEIKKTPAADIVASSPNQDDICTTITIEQQKLRDRINDKLKQK